MTPTVFKSSSRFFVVLTIAFFIPHGGAINRTSCDLDIRASIQNHTLSSTNTSFFSHIPASLDTSTPLIIHVSTCRSQCGPGFSWYDNNEISAHIVGWLVPVLVLVGNVHMPALAAKFKAFSLFHFIGDPIDTMLSLQHTLAVRHAAYGWAEETVRSLGLVDVDPRDLAAVFWALDTLDAGAKRTPIKILKPLLRMRELPFAVAEAAADIRRTTVKEAARTYLALVVYLCTIAGAFIKSATGSSQCGSKPGNRIAFAMLFSWMLPSILLSTFAGRFTTSDACAGAIRRFAKHLNMPEHSLLPYQYQSRALAHRSDTSSVQEAAPYSGAIYLYRQRKTLLSRPIPFFPAPVSMLVLSVVPIVLAMFIAVAVSYNTPTVGLGCRSITEISISTLWLLSFATTVLLRKSGLFTGKYHLIVSAVKDTIIGGGTIFLVAIVFAGRFNSCWCWSNGLNGVIGHDLFVALGVDAKLQANAESLYPALVGGGLGAQTVIFLLMWGGGWADRKWWGIDRRRRDDDTRVASGLYMSTAYRQVNTSESESGIALVQVTPKMDHQRGYAE